MAPYRESPYHLERSVNHGPPHERSVSHGPPHHGRSLHEHSVSRGVDRVAYAAPYGAPSRPRQTRSRSSRTPRPRPSPRRASRELPGGDNARQQRLLEYYQRNVAPRMEQERAPERLAAQRSPRAYAHAYEASPQYERPRAPPVETDAGRFEEPPRVERSYRAFEGRVPRAYEPPPPVDRAYPGGRPRESSQSRPSPLERSYPGSYERPRPPQAERPYRDMTLADLVQQQERPKRTKASEVSTAPPSLASAASAASTPSVASRETRETSRPARAPPIVEEAPRRELSVREARTRVPLGMHSPRPAPPRVIGPVLRPALERTPSLREEPMPPLPVRTPRAEPRELRRDVSPVRPLTELSARANRARADLQRQMIRPVRAAPGTADATAAALAALKGGANAEDTAAAAVAAVGGGAKMIRPVRAAPAPASPPRSAAMGMAMAPPPVKPHGPSARVGEPSRLAQPTSPNHRVRAAAVVSPPGRVRSPGRVQSPAQEGPTPEFLNAVRMVARGTAGPGVVRGDTSARMVEAGQTAVGSLAYIGAQREGR